MSARKYAKSIVFCVAMLFFLMPVVWVFVNSFKSTRSILLGIFSYDLTVGNYVSLFMQSEFVHSLFNTLFVDFVVLGLCFVVCTPAAYALARYRFRYDQGIANSIVSFWFLPSVSVVIPFYLIFRSAGWLDTYQALVCVYLLVDIPFVTWLLRGFFREVPREIEEAALLDGLGEWGSLLRIVIPLAKGGIVVTFLLAFVFIWNEYLLALILTGASTHTLPIFMSSQETVMGLQWGILTAATVVLSLPMIVIAVYLRREIATGLTLGAIRG